MTRTAFRGWSLVGWTALGVGALVIALLAVGGAGAEGLSAVLRWTARTSALLLFSAISASSLHALWPGPLTRWVLANRRYIGVSFATSHAYHLAAVVAYAARPETRVAPETAIFGGLAYAFIAAMVATSFDRSAGWLGARRWKLLHTTGAYYLWFFFTLFFAGASARHPLAAVFALLGLAALGVRVAATLARRRSAST
jgi:hypothetical protein